MAYEQTCPRCGEDFSRDDFDAVVAHARGQTRHELDRDVVLARLEGRHPFDDDLDT